MSIGEKVGGSVAYVAPFLLLHILSSTLLYIGLGLPTKFEMRYMLRGEVADYIAYPLIALYTDGWEEFYELFKSHRNLLFPVLWAKILDSEFVYVFLANMILVWSSLIALLKGMKPKDGAKYVMLFIVSPVMSHVVGIFSKEVFALASVVLLLAFIQRKKRRFIVLAITASIFARVEMTVMILAFVVGVKLVSPSRRLRYIIGLLVGMSIALTYVDITSPMEYIVNRGSGIGLYLNYESSRGFYFLAFVPKLAMNLFADVVNLNYQVNIGSLTYMLSQTLMVVVILKVVYDRYARYTKMERSVTVTLLDDRVFFLWIVFVISSAAIVVQWRYFLPAYPVLIHMLVLPRSARVNDTRKRANTKP